MSRFSSRSRRSINPESANIVPLGERRSSFTGIPPSKRTRTDSSSGRGGGRGGDGHFSSDAAAAVSAGGYSATTSYTSQSSLGRGEERRGTSSSHQFAGQEAETIFPDPKTILNNALLADLRRLNTRLEYRMECVPAPHGGRNQFFHCYLDLPYPEEITVIGEASNKKDAEKRCAAAACAKLVELRFLDQRGKKAESLPHPDVTEDQKPKQLVVTMANQVQLYETISLLPDCHKFTHWSSIKSYYTAQKKLVRSIPMASGSAVFKFKFSLPLDLSGSNVSRGALSSSASGTMETVSQATSVVLPGMLQKQFPVGVDTRLAVLSCPGCHSDITVSMSYLGREEEEVMVDTLSIGGGLEERGGGGGGGGGLTSTFPEIGRKLKGEEEPVSIFSNVPYSDLTNEEAEFRSGEMQKEQKKVEQLGMESRTPRSVARKLPIHRARNSLLREINTKSVVVVMGMTGSGKTTQVPQFILENYIEHMVGATCNIVVTQPRRISAISIAERVAAERGEMVGQTVGYQVRLDSIPPKGPGRILFCTTGVLLMKLRKNPLLKGVSHVIVDEVHERDINSDFLLILLREIVRAGQGTKVILMSASVDAQLYINYFTDRRAGITEVPCVNVEGHCYPVTEVFLDRICNLIGWRGMTSEDQGLPGTDPELVSTLILYLTRTQPEGAILVFLPGWDDIMSVIDLLNHRLRNETKRYLILPLHSMLSSRDQQSVFDVPPAGVRKIILATNIAESSVTIDDIVYVVNTGTVKVKIFDPTKKITHLSTQWSSKASVTQRKGRAGRCQTGHAYNLFTREQYSSMDEYQVPEMQRTPLEDLVLQAKVLNPDQRVVNFLSQALNPPRTSAVGSAVGVLMELGALDDNEMLTPMGKALAELPIEPVIGRLVLLGAILGALDPILTIAASMGYRDPFVSPPTKRQQADEVRSTMAAGCYSDHLLVIKAYEQWQEARREGNDFSFVRDNFLHRGTLSMMEGLRRQFQTHLDNLGVNDIKSYNEHRDSEPMIRAILTAGLDKNIMKTAKMLESAGYRSTTSTVQRKRVRMGFKTIQDGRVFIHPSSVNSEKNFPSNWFVYYEKVKTSKVFIRDSTLIHPLTLLLFGGRSLDIISQEGETTVLGVEGKNWYSFEVPTQLAHLLRCGRQAIESTLTLGLMGRLGHLSPHHRQFLCGLNTFLINNTNFD